MHLWPQDGQVDKEAEMPGGRRPHLRQNVEDHFGMSIKELMRFLINEKEMSLADIAEFLGISKATPTNWCQISGLLLTKVVHDPSTEEVVVRSKLYR